MLPELDRSQRDSGNLEERLQRVSSLYFAGLPDPGRCGKDQLELNILSCTETRGLTSLYKKHFAEERRGVENKGEVRTPRAQPHVSRVHPRTTLV